ncbi:hypothetical protein IMCC1989_482 [gamma proteobacterium IMCC1989]|nr:hypothetical protein IMCC1989_482 [gamma proteobacterium IMCC1989]
MVRNNTIHVVGLGVAENAQLSTDAQRALHSADIIFGSKRQLATIAAFELSETTEQRLLPPLSALKSQLKNELKAVKHYTIVMLASGIPYITASDVGSIITLRIAPYIFIRLYRAFKPLAMN